MVGSLISRSAALAGAAGFALAIGALVYAADRASSRVALVPAFAILDTGPLFGPWGQWLPSFVHPLAFSLLAAAVRPRGAGPAYSACMAWWLVNVAFEAGQFLRLVPGTFDVGDIAAAALGAVAAAVLMQHVQQRENDNGN